MKHPSVIIIVLLFNMALLQQCTNSNAGQGEGDHPAAPSGKALPVLFHQSASEYRALCYQAFNLARLRLDMDLRRAAVSLQQAIVMDIDETVLDNSPYEASSILNNFVYPEHWSDWVNLASAKAVPGSLEFLSYAESGGVEVFYITNRKEEFRAPTLKNLKALGFPFADDEHLFMRTSTSSKKERREKVSERHRIVMFIGDNLNDFSEVFEKLPAGERNAKTDEYSERFGTSFIVLPNVIYGDWENALYNYTKGLDAEVRWEMMKERLEPF